MTARTTADEDVRTVKSVFDAFSNRDRTSYRPRAARSDTPAHLGVL